MDTTHPENEPAPSAEGLRAIAEHAITFAATQKTLVLATCNRDGLPEASYAPFVEHDGDYYVYVSELAVHCANLLIGGRCSIMFIADEAQSRNLFARERVVLQCEISEIARDTPGFEHAMTAMTQKFGSTMKVIGKLTDFHLFKLAPVDGGYVGGFAKAYRLSGEKLREIRWRNEKGHRTDDESVRRKMDSMLQ